MNDTFTEKAPWLCLTCGYKMDSATPAVGPPAVPTPGDLSMCLNCGTVYFRDDEAWRKPTVEELLAFDEPTMQLLARMRRHRLAVITRDLTERDPEA